MRDVQPPITNDEEYHGYQLAHAKLTKMLERREQVLFEMLATNPDRVEAARYDLLHILRKRQGIVDAIAAYERRQHDAHAADEVPTHR